MSFINFLKNIMLVICCVIIIGLICREVLYGAMLYVESYFAEIIALLVLFIIVTLICYSIISFLSKCIMNKRMRKNLSNRYYSTGYDYSRGYNSNQSTRKGSGNSNRYNCYKDNTILDTYLMSQRVINSEDNHDYYHDHECHEPNDHQGYNEPCEYESHVCESYEVDSYDSYDVGDSYDSCDCGSWD